jgi:hypothetical protein
VVRGRLSPEASGRGGRVVRGRLSPEVSGRGGRVVRGRLSPGVSGRGAQFARRGPSERPGPDCLSGRAVVRRCPSGLAVLRGPPGLAVLGCQAGRAVSRGPSVLRGRAVLAGRSARAVSRASPVGRGREVPRGPSPVAGARRRCWSDERTGRRAPWAEYDVGLRRGPPAAACVSASSRSLPPGVIRAPGAVPGLRKVLGFPAVCWLRPARGVGLSSPGSPSVRTPGRLGTRAPSARCWPAHGGFLPALDWPSAPGLGACCADLPRPSDRAPVTGPGRLGVPPLVFRPRGVPRPSATPQPPASAIRLSRQAKRVAQPHRERPSSSMSGGVLLSHTVPRAVPSALKSLTSGFGMGPGVSPSL